MIEAELPDGTILEFPEGTDQYVVQSAVKKYLAQSDQPSEPSSDIQQSQPRKTGRMARAESIASQRDKTQDLLNRYQAGELSSSDVSTQEMEDIRKARIEAIPEITGSFKNLSKNLGFTQALAGMTAFDPDEFGQILTDADPNIGVVTTPEGERIAINRATNEAMSINKAGPSLIDAIQLGGAASIFTPSGAISGIGRQAVGAAATQAAIEAGQSAAGGEFDTGEVALAGAAVPVVAGAIKYGKGALENLQRTVRSAKPLIDVNTGSIKPEFSKALARYDIDVGALIDDQANLPVIYSGASPDEVVENIVKKQINTGKSPAYLAKLRLDPKGNIIDDDLGRLAHRQGFDLGDIASIKQANEPTRKTAGRMLNAQRAIMADKSKVDEFRPSDFVGDSVMERFDFLRDRAQKLSDDLNRMASKELTVSGRKLIGNGGDRLKGMDIDPSIVENAVFKELEKLNIEGLDDILSGVREPIFKAIDNKKFFDGSDIMKDPTSQKILRDVIDLLKHNPDGPIDALRAHRVKRQIDSMIDFNKKSSTGLTESGRRFAISVRRALNDSIRDVSPKYAKVNDELSSALQAMGGFEDSVGRRIDLFDIDSRKAVGTEMRKLLSNYGVRQTLNNSLNALDDTAKALGGNFRTDYRELNRFANVLDKRFGSVAENSFAGNIEKALNLNTIRNTSIKDAAIQKGLGKIADKFGPNDQKAMDVMNQLLVRGK